MPSINIKEVDYTVFSSSQNSTDNVVFIPGPAVTGPANEPTLCNSYNEFVTKFGANPPVSNNIGTAWDIAANLLIRGFSVLYERIVPTTGVVQASADLTGILVTPGEGSDPDTESEVIIGSVKEIYGGTFGNSLSYRIVKTANSVYFRVYVGESHRQLESVFLYNIGESEAADKTAFINAIGTKLTTQYVEVTLNTPAVTFTKVNYNTANSYSPLAGGTDATDSAIKALVPEVYSSLTDKYLYDFKFITSGTYTDPANTTNGINTAMITLAQDRGDCIAFVDVPFGTASSNVYSYYSGSTSYAAAYAPWAYMNLETGSAKWMPPSFIFLYTLARSINNGNKIWDVPAGVNRATVSEIIKPEYEIGSGILETWQNDNGICINPIMKLRQYGYVIYGQRTLMNTGGVQSVLQEVGVRIIANEIKKLIANAAVSLTFERNTLHTWNAFRSKIEPTLANMKSSGGIVDYQVVMDATTTYPIDIAENKIKGVVRVSIARAAEDFEIGFELHDSSVTFSNNE